VGGGVIWKEGGFWGVDFGTSISQSVLSFSGGNVYDLRDQLQLVYGVSIGSLWGAPSYDGEFNDKDNGALIFVAPFIKLRWKYVELTYRGVFETMTMYYQDDEYEYHDLYKPKFGWNNQLMLGLYFATSKRER
jgi:hypothetical protein